ncbi:hypothetical protein ACJJIQ_02085 [Microbulbifer sp. ANSA003]|uniref:DUF7674 family protein n=1 Tax=Microbulbifer sp. ANSA003 TaxID=3243360 RepID=UPI0040414770
MSQIDFINALLSSCDDIEDDWQEHLDFWEGDIPEFYNDISVIVHYITNRYVSNQYTDFDKLFSVVEKGVISNDEETSELATIGFLEGILLVGSHSGIKPVQFEKWLGKKSRESIYELREFFSKNT